MKKCLVIFLLAFSSFGLLAQSSDSLSLDECQKLARENYPLIKQLDLLGEITTIKINNLNKTWFPQLYLNAQASYQSDVTQISLPIPNIQIPEMNKDVYKVSLDVNQMIYDGNQTSYLKSIERADQKTEQQSVEVALNSVRERINQLYFTALQLQENEKLVLAMQQEIRSKLSKVEAAVRNDAALQLNADVLNAEILKTDQQLIEIRVGKEATLNMLGQFIKRDLSPTTGLGSPQSMASTVPLTNIRPEMLLFDVQMEKLDAGKKLSTSRLLPRLSLFGQVGYGRPGLNMLDPEFDSWAMGGLKLSWNLWNWNYSANEKKVIDLRKNILQAQKETFDLNVQAGIQKDLADIKKYNELMIKDREIIALREKIVTTLSVQLDNGMITATEYTTELNAVTLAKLNMHMHQIQQLQALYNYLYNTGN